METTAPAPSREFIFERPARARTNFELAMRRFARQKLAMAGLVIVLFLTFVAVFAPLIAPTGYAETDLMSAKQFPSWSHPFGTDTIGHDYLSRVIFGIRTSFLVGLLAVAVACCVGIPLGLIAGLRGGLADFLVLRLVEIWTAFPNILFAMFLLSVINSGVLSGVFSNRVRNVALVIGVTSWVGLCRLTRAQILTLREHEYVTAARSLGASDFQIAVRHLLPNAVPPLIIAITLLMPAAIFAEAGLSFLGLAINEPTPSLGKMVADSRQWFQLYWYLAVFPTAAIALAVLGFAFVGDGLRDALDPRQN
ncbi:MAG TPA: ABC transporter permease [Thermomicrobiales bacterium]|jgi:oligopeptide transport system permease protein